MNTIKSNAEGQDQSPPQNMFSRTFYRRELPPTLISFSSPKGRDIFQSAVAKGGTFSFFALIEQLQTQSEPAYCGLTTLVIILNALAVDPRVSWKGPWRWYDESMLNCCLDLEKAKQTGITFKTFSCLARCQGLDVNAVYGSNSTVDEFRSVVKSICTTPSSTQTQPTSYLVVSYTRKVVGQTGAGHFSPIGAYDEASDYVLLLDTARFKYGPHWIPLELMFEALLPLDPDSGKSRGYVVLSYNGLGDASNGTGEENFSHLPLSVLFRSTKSKDFLRREYKQHVNVLAKGIGLEDVVSYWTKNYTNNTLVWELVSPQLQPVDLAEIQMVTSIRSLIKSLIKADQVSQKLPPTLFETSRGLRPGGECCTSSTLNSSRRVLEISPAEALYVIYLASLPSDASRSIVYTDNDEGLGENIDDTVREQLLAEAALISYAMETCDSDM